MAVKNTRFAIGEGRTVLRWWPIIALSASILSFFIHAIDLDGAKDFAVLVAAIGVIIASLCMLFGPLRLQRPRTLPLDEREQLERAKAFGCATGIITVLALWITTGAALDDWLVIWTPQDKSDWRLFQTILVTILLAVPPLYISWKRPSDEFPLAES